MGKRGEEKKKKKRKKTGKESERRINSAFPVIYMCNKIPAGGSGGGGNKAQIRHFCSSNHPINRLICSTDGRQRHHHHRRRCHGRKHQSPGTASSMLRRCRHRARPAQRTGQAAPHRNAAAAAAAHAGRTCRRIRAKPKAASTSGQATATGPAGCPQAAWRGPWRWRRRRRWGHWRRASRGGEGG